SVITLRQQVAAGADGESPVPVAAALVAVRNWAIAIGANMAPFNALMLGTALYRARLVPRWMPALGLVGAPILISFVIGLILGVAHPGTLFHVVAVLPFFVWELALGLWLTFKGFNENSSIGLAGRRRVAMVGYYEDGPNLVTLAMNGWGTTEPAWWLNLQAVPEARVELPDGPRLIVARAASGAERDRLWASFAEYPGWGDDIGA